VRRHVLPAHACRVPAPAPQAVKYSRPGGNITLRLDFEPGEQPWLTLSVKDAGIGLAPEQLDAVFQPFVQGEADTHARYGGTGLGLAVREQRKGSQSAFATRRG
jgi:signal transduction histidine kinase